MKRDKVLLSLASMLAGAAMVAGLTLGGSVQAQSAPAAAVPAVAQAQGTNLSVMDAQGQLLVDPETTILHQVYNSVNPSVVSINVRMPTGGGSAMVTPFGQALSPYAYAAGSGFVYDNQNHIVTNAHVVDGTDRIEVTFSDRTMRHATLVGMDTDSDIAVIRVEGDMSQYAPVPLANSDELAVGDLAIAIGNPFQRSGTMTHGIISGLHRSVQALTQGDGGGTYTIPDAIQTDAPINPGNSGGPLLNSQGEVVGVNEQIESSVRQSSGVSFAIPSNIVSKVADAIIKDGRVDHAWLGIAGVSLSLDLNEALSLPEDTQGVYVSQVTPDSPASNAGLKVGTRTVSVNSADVPVGGDVITAIDGQPVKDFDSLTEYLFSHTTPGQTVTLTILRDGQTQQLQAKLQARPHTS